MGPCQWRIRLVSKPFTPQVTENFSSYMCQQNKEKQNRNLSLSRWIPSQKFGKSSRLPPDLFPSLLDSPAFKISLEPACFSPCLLPYSLPCLWAHFLHFSQSHLNCNLGTAFPYLILLWLSLSWVEPFPWLPKLPLWCASGMLDTPTVTLDWAVMKTSQAFCPQNLTFCLGWCGIGVGNNPGSK